MQTEQQNVQAREGATADLVRAFHVAHQHELAGETDQAVTIYRGLLQAAPDQPDVLHNLGLLLRVRDPVESEALLRRAVSVAGQEPAFRNSLGALLFDQGRTGEARSRPPAITPMRDSTLRCCRSRLASRVWLWRASTHLSRSTRAMRNRSLESAPCSRRSATRRSRCSSPSVP